MEGANLRTKSRRPWRPPSWSRISARNLSSTPCLNSGRRNVIRR